MTIEDAKVVNEGRYKGIVEPAEGYGPQDGIYTVEIYARGDGIVFSHTDGMNIQDGIDMIVNEIKHLQENE